eukprot:13713294-Alexandrium_andersonii.AAC.1
MPTRPYCGAPTTQCSHQRRSSLPPTDMLSHLVIVPPPEHAGNQLVRCPPRGQAALGRSTRQQTSR